METYRLINKELSINNQELRNVVCKLKQEITYLNRLIFDQREEFLCIKASIAKTIEQKYKETMAFIYPDKQFPDQKQISKLDIKSLRRSCSNATAADPINNRSQSPPVSSSGVDISTQSKTNITVERPYRRSNPSIIIEQSSRLSRSPVKSPQSRTNERHARKSADLKSSRKSTGNMDDFDESELSQTLMSSNTSLNTINEEKSGALDVPSETLSDATINCLLDAPCSTPYNFLKQSNDTTIRFKEVRVKIKKLSEEQLSNPNFFEKSCTHPSLSRLTKSFKIKKEQIEACHTRHKYSQADTSTKIRPLTNTLVKSEITNNCTLEKVLTKKVKTRLKGKENIDTDSEFPYSDEETQTTTRSRRLRQKQPMSFKEPSLITKMRNTKNTKL